MLTSLFLAIGAFNGQNNLLFFTFGLSVLAILLSGIIGGTAIMGLRISRTPLQSLQIGTTASLGYRVENRNRFLPVFGVILEELRIDPASSAVVALQAACVPALRAGETSHPRASLTPKQSGVLRLTGFRVRSSMPFGLLEKRITYTVPHALEIHPAVLPVHAGMHPQVGSTRSRTNSPGRRLGLGDEFLGVRDYRPGDPLRHIAWRRSASGDTLAVKTHAEPTPDTCWLELVLPNPDPIAQEAALAAVASLAAARLQRGTSVGLLVQEWGIELTPRPGPGQLARILSTLARRTQLHDDSSNRHLGERLVVSSQADADSEGARIAAPAIESWVLPGTPIPAGLIPNPALQRTFADRLREFLGKEES